MSIERKLMKDATRWEFPNDAAKAHDQADHARELITYLRLEQHAMHTNKSVADLFQEEPRQWRLRGDPHLWREMKAILGSTPYPSTEEQLTALLEQTYQQLTGVPLTNPDPIFIERYSHGGMSSGYVSPQFWAEKAIPLLQTRYRDTA